MNRIIFKYILTSYLVFKCNSFISESSLNCTLLSPTRRLPAKGSTLLFSIMDINNNSLSRDMFRTTQLWNEIIEDFKIAMLFKTKKSSLTSHHNLFTGHQATKWLHNYLKCNPAFCDDITQKHVATLSQKLMDYGIFEKVFQKDAEFGGHYSFYRLKKNDGVSGMKEQNLLKFKSEPNLHDSQTHRSLKEWSPICNSNSTNHKRQLIEIKKTKLDRFKSFYRSEINLLDSKLQRRSSMNLTKSLHEIRVTEHHAGHLQKKEPKIGQSKSMYERLCSIKKRTRLHRSRKELQGSTSTLQAKSHPTNRSTEGKTTPFGSQLNRETTPLIRPRYKNTQGATFGFLFDCENEEETFDSNSFASKLTMTSSTANAKTNNFVQERSFVLTGTSTKRKIQHFPLNILDQSPSTAKKIRQRRSLINS